MSDYHLLPADKDGKAIASFDSWGEARAAWERIRDKQPVRLICMWGCGCLRQAIRKGNGATHSGWRAKHVD